MSSPESSPGADPLVDGLEKLFERAVDDARRSDRTAVTLDRPQSRGLRPAARKAAGLVALGLIIVLAGQIAVGAGALGGKPQATVAPGSASPVVPVGSGLSGDYAQKYAAWMARLNLSSIDWASLPRGLSTASFLPPPETLASAVAEANVIVEGQVLELKPRAAPFTTDLTIRVSKSIKGASSGTITMWEDAGLEPDETWSEKPTILESEAEPLLTPGQRVVLLLMERPEGGLSPEPYTGIYYVTESGIQPLAYNPFGSTLTGMPEATFAALLH